MATPNASNVQHNNMAKIPGKDSKAVEGKTVTDNHGNHWPVAAWVNEAGARYAHIQHNGRDFYLMPGGAPLLLVAGAMELRRGKPITPETKAPLAKKTAGSTNVRLGKSITFNQGAFELIRKFNRLLTPEEKDENKLGETISAILVEHFQPLVDTMFAERGGKVKAPKVPVDPKEAFLASASKLGITLSPDILAALGRMP